MEEVERSPAGEGPVPPMQGNSESVRHGGWWRWDLWLALAAAMVSAFLLPLDDADLPMHLRTGAWILEHGQLPMVEPFAWTRAGSPFYAYSWLPEVLYSSAWRAGGASLLSTLHAVLLGGVVLALWWLARAADWTRWSARLVMSVHLVLWLTVQPATRPQLFLAIALPMAWAGAFQLQRTNAGARWAALAGVFFANVLVVNSHLFFFLMLAPIVVLLAERKFSRQRVLAFTAATIGGWVVCPYLLQLPKLLALNLGENALLGAASPIMELEGGFHLLMHAAIGTRLLVGGLLLLPLLPFFAVRTPRERWWYGLSWLAGLGLYGLAVRGLLIWWLLALPLVAWAVATIPLPTLLSTRRLVVIGWCLSIVGLLGQAQKARALAPKAVGLPHPMATELAAAVAWLECAVPTGNPAVRATTAFDYGSYLTWRLPQFSWSIDGRSIFPDSVARADARQELRGGLPIMPPWRSGDVVLLASTHAVWHDVSQDTAWVQVPLPNRSGRPVVAMSVRREIALRSGRCNSG